MVKFFKNFGDKFEINGVKWKDCAHLLKVSGILTILLLIFIVLSLLSMILLPEDITTKIIGAVGIFLLFFNVKISWKN